MKHTRKNLRPNGKKTWPLAGLAGRVKVRVNKSISAGRRNIRIHWGEDNTPGIISGAIVNYQSETSTPAR